VKLGGRRWGLFYAGGVEALWIPNNRRGRGRCGGSKAGIFFNCEKREFSLAQFQWGQRRRGRGRADYMRTRKSFERGDFREGNFLKGGEELH